MPSISVKHLGVSVGSITYAAITPPASLPKVRTDPTPIVNSIIARHKSMLDDICSLCSTFLSDNIKSHEPVVDHVLSASSIVDVYDLVDGSKNKWPVDVDGVVAMYNDAISEAFNVTVDTFNKHFDAKSSVGKIYYYYGIHSKAAAAYKKYSTDVPAATSDTNTKFSDLISSSSVTYNSLFSSICSAALSRSLALSLSRYRAGIAPIVASIHSSIQSVSNLPVVDLQSDIVSSLAADVNSSLNLISSLNDTLNADLAAIKYGASEQDDMMADFNSSVDAIRSSLSDLVSEFEDAVESHSTDVISYTADRSSSEFSHDVLASRDDLERDISSMSRSYSNKAVSESRMAIDNYLKSHRVSRTMDSVALRNEIGNMKSVLRGIVSDVVDGVMSDFRTAVTGKINRFNSDVGKHYSSLNKSIGKVSVSVPTLDAILADLETTINGIVSDVNSSIESYLTDVSYTTSGEAATVHGYLSSAVEQYASSAPILRISKIISFPASFPSDSYPVFSFEVSNGGNTMWLGWFGIKLVDDNDNTFTYNVRPIGMISVPGKSTRRVDLKVPVAKLVGDGAIGRVVSSTLITNTFRGNVPSLPK